jgi:linearmycin/streptolysin S transport system permease protein
MRTVLTMAMKDLRLMSRDWLGMFFIIGFPIAIGLFFGQIMGPFDTKKASLNIAVVDEDKSAMSARFIEALRDTGNLSIETPDRATAMEHVRRGQLVGMIAVPKGFGETAGMFWQKGPAIAVGIDPSRSAESGMLQGMIMQSVGKLMGARMQDPASMRTMIEKSRKDILSNKNISPVMRPLIDQMMGSLDGFLKSLADANAAEQKNGGGKAANMPELEIARIQTLDVTREIPKGSNEALVRQLRSKWDISFPQASMWGVLACAAGFAITLVRERKQGTLMRLQVAPVTRTQILAGKATACYLAVIGVIAVMLALGMALGMRPRSFGLLAVAALCIAFCFVGIMMLMSVIGKTEESVSGAAWSANMFMSMFGGGMVPLLFMPSFMKTLSNFSPVKWSILALEGSIWRNFTIGEMMAPCAVLIGTGVICLAIGARVLSRATS